MALYSKRKGINRSRLCCVWAPWTFILRPTKQPSGNLFLGQYEMKKICDIFKPRVFSVNAPICFRSVIAMFRQEVLHNTVSSMICERGSSSTICFLCTGRTRGNIYLMVYISSVYVGLPDIIEGRHWHPLAHYRLLGTAHILIEQVWHTQMDGLYYFNTCWSKIWKLSIQWNISAICWCSGSFFNSKNSFSLEREKKNFFTVRNWLETKHIQSWHHFYCVSQLKSIFKWVCTCWCACLWRPVIKPALPHSC